MPTTPNPIPKLLDSEYDALKASIAESGQMVPIIRSAGPACTGEIVDGFHRQRICDELGLTAATVTRPFATEAEFRLAQIDANVARRQLTQIQRIHLARARLPWEKQLAEERIRTKGAQGSSAQGNGTGRATEVAAKAVGLKRKTLEAANFVLDRGPKEIRDRFNRGEISVDRAYKEARRAKGMDARSVLAHRTNQRFGPLPTGKYGALLVTPPWRSQAMKFESGRVISTELQALDLARLAGKDAIVCLWTPSLWLREAYDVVDTWGAQPFALATHVLDDAEQTDSIRDRTRHGILATFGRPPAQTRHTNVFLGGSGVRPPSHLYALLDALVPQARGIVLFGAVERAGWESWDPDID